MFQDLEILNKKNYRLEIRIESELFIFKWKELQIREMLKIFEQIKFDPDKSNLEYQVQLIILVSEFLNKLDKKFTHEYFKKISTEKFTEVLEKIMEPLYGDAKDNNSDKKVTPKKAIIRFTRQMMFLIRHSNGAFDHESILNLTFSQFFAYNKALAYVMRGETKEGANQNFIEDKKEELRNTKKEDIDKIRDDIAKKKKKWEHLINPQKNA